MRKNRIIRQEDRVRKITRGGINQGRKTHFKWKVRPIHAQKRY